LASTRVYLLAKKLGVKSTAIVEKCQAEGLDVKNHMSTISAGLAATIEDWFSEGASATSVETAERVNLSKVRIKRKKRKVAKEKPAEKKKAEVKPKPTEKVKVSKKAVAAAPEAKPKEKKAKKKKPAAKKKKVLKKKVPKKKVPKKKPPKPEPIVPAGPILEKPEPAKLAGPRVVRVEKPEVTAKPARPKTKPKPPRPRYDEPVTEPLIYDEKIQSKLGLKSKKPIKPSKTKTRIRPYDIEDEEVGKRPKLLRKLRQRDIEERRARVEAASAESLRLRPSRKIETGRRSETAAPARPEKVTISSPITVKDLSAALGAKTSDIIMKLMGQGVMATVNQIINTEVAELIAIDFGVELVTEQKISLEQQIGEEFKKLKRNKLQKRCPVVTMLGHVDHGKTSLLDYIRSSKVAAGEAGGITQHIGAYQVSWDSKKVTFLDTPGHEAFTAMRARGANITDIVVLVVAADDGVMPQTVEAIHHATAAGVPIVVALNKTDLPGCDINRVYGQLAENGLAAVDWGGQTEVVQTSAVTGAGIQDLLEHLDYVAELLDLKADNTIPGTGWIIEARMAPHEGPVATLLVKEGRIRKGDIILTGQSCGRIRTLRDYFGRDISEATSSMPVEITGLDDVPQAGDRFYRLDDINRAKQVAEENQARSREKTLARRAQITLDNLFSHIEAGNIKELNLIVRADVQGSVDVLSEYLTQLSMDEVRVRILHAAVGGITEGDVVLAEASSAIIIGFNVVPEDKAAKIAEAKGIDIRLYNVIYRITEDLKSAIAGLLQPEEQEKTLGRAEVRNTFKIAGVGTIAGCHVVSGVANINAKVRLIRDNIVLNNAATIESLRHFKEDVREIKAGFECGIKIAGFDDVKLGDVLEFYEVIEVARKL
jgi:translation initiation factor IF-2